MGSGKIDSRSFLAKVERSTKFRCCFVETRFSVWNLFKLVSYVKFGFSRPDLDGNKLAKGMCLARKPRDREMFI